MYLFPCLIISLLCTLSGHFYETSINIVHLFTLEDVDSEANIGGDVVKIDDNDDTITVKDGTPSPRTMRAAEVAAAIMNPLDKSLQNQEPQDVFGMRSR